MHALHSYLADRHQVGDYEEYLRLLAMFRNAAAIEATKARARHSEIRDAISQILAIRDTLLEDVDFN
jgi:hypothetical protein